MSIHCKKEKDTKQIYPLSEPTYLLRGFRMDPIPWKDGQSIERHTHTFRFALTYLKEIFIHLTVGRKHCTQRQFTLTEKKATPRRSGTTVFVLLTIPDDCMLLLNRKKAV